MGGKHTVFGCGSIPRHLFRSLHINSTRQAARRLPPFVSLLSLTSSSSSSLSHSFCSSFLSPSFPLASLDAELPSLLAISAITGVNGLAPPFGGNFTTLLGAGGLRTFCFLRAALQQSVFVQTSPSISTLFN